MTNRGKYLLGRDELTFGTKGDLVKSGENSGHRWRCRSLSQPRKEKVQKKSEYSVRLQQLQTQSALLHRAFGEEKKKASEEEEQSMRNSKKARISEIQRRSLGGTD